MRVVLLLSSLACVALLGLHAWRENLGTEWRPYQQAYARALAARAQTDAERAAARGFEIELRQVVTAGGIVIDRCVSCHTAIEDPRMKHEPEPLRTHPGDYVDVHPVERFGCTLCHDGQGLAVNFQEAAAYERSRFWEKPLLKRPFVEANCYRCHTEVLRQTPTYARGKQIFDGSGCIGCHTVRGRGGAVGPDLSEVGDSSRYVKVPTSQHHDLVARFRGNETVAYLYEAVRWPSAQPARTTMPDFGFTDEEVVALVVYLKSLVRPPAAASLLPPTRPPLPPTDPVQRGLAVYAKYCIGCHGESGKGGIPNPNAKNSVIPPINTLAHRMGFVNETQVAEFIAIVRGLDGTELAESTAAQLANWPRIQQTMAEIRQTIAQGFAVASVDPRGAEPLDMPSWRHLLDEAQIDTLIYYLLTAMPSGEGGPSPLEYP